MAKAKVTPVRQQYLDVKRQFPNAIVFFRLGDFYETFDEDAQIVAGELDIVLTSRNVSKSQRIPMAGVPHHAADNYIARLIEKGYHVAICDQIGEEPVNGLMPREVTRVVTPGTITDPALLPDKRNNYLVAIYPVFEKDSHYPTSAGLAYADISTGEFAVTEFAGKDTLGLIQQEIARLSPRECLIPDLLDDVPLNLGSDSAHITPYAGWRFEPSTARQTLEMHFQVSSLGAFGLEGASLAVGAAGGILAYLQETQRGGLSQIVGLQTYTIGDYMVLDAPTRRNLELTETIRDRRTRGSLLGVLDRTVTAMGGRMLRHWINQPLLDIARLNRRLDAIEAFYVDGILRAQVREILREIGDMERLTNRVLTGTAGPRELFSLVDSLRTLPNLRAHLIGQEQSLRDLANGLDPVENVADLIDAALEDEPPATVNTVGIIRKGYSPELDAIFKASNDARQYINALETVERNRTGIKTLKVGYNKVFGYYIEVTKANSDTVPDEYIRKQTLVNAERYITPEMKEAEVKLLNAEEEIHAIELRLFRELLGEVARYSEALLRTARTLGRIDVVATLAEVAARNSFVRPILSEDDILHIQAGRHPVVEHLLSGGDRFVPNDTTFSEAERVHVITGPNMAGKSTYLRQVAVILLMAQIGAFVPADEAHIGLVDRIFTRIGAQDEIHAGQSTFMVEMVETALILQQSTRRSLIILDEIGRGTSTYDGLAIARAVIEYLHNHPRMGGKTLFATHYHELTELENILPGVLNYNVTVSEQGDQIAFLHSIQRGRADKSYGIHVAHLAGVPRAVVQRADSLLNDLEKGTAIWEIDTEKAPPAPKTGDQLSMFTAKPHPALDILRDLKIEEMSPIDAITRLYELQRIVRGEG
jgi:DNA mismatch repair protein MutS